MAKFRVNEKDSSIFVFDLHKYCKKALTREIVTQPAQQSDSSRCDGRGMRFYAPTMAEVGEQRGRAEDATVAERRSQGRDGAQC
jgi:hypothetical protein